MEGEEGRKRRARILLLFAAAWRNHSVDCTILRDFIIHSKRNVIYLIYIMMIIASSLHWRTEQQPFNITEEAEAFRLILG